MSYEELDLYLISATPKAYLLSLTEDKKDAEWVPKQMTNDPYISPSSWGKWIDIGVEVNMAIEKGFV